MSHAVDRENIREKWVINSYVEKVEELTDFIFHHWACFYKWSNLKL